MPILIRNGSLHSILVSHLFPFHPIGLEESHNSDHLRTAIEMGNHMWARPSANLGTPLPADLEHFPHAGQESVLVPATSNQPSLGLDNHSATPSTAMAIAQLNREAG
jgi:hypothetical protein